MENDLIDFVLFTPGIMSVAEWILKFELIGEFVG